jgi:hypothetical protein
VAVDEENDTASSSDLGKIPVLSIIDNNSTNNPLVIDAFGAEHTKQGIVSKVHTFWSSDQSYTFVIQMVCF